MPHLTEKISVVIPVYLSEPFLPELYARLVTVFQKLDIPYEIIFVNDASPDGAWEKIQQLAAHDPCVKGLNLSRNFGQHYAINAGLSHVTGEWIVVMDGDLQDQPEEIPKLYRKAMEGYDAVAGRRTIRFDRWLKKIGSRVFYSVLSYLTATRHDGTIGNFGIYHRKVITAVCSFKETLRFFPVMVRAVGFRFTAIPIEHASRDSGSSSYTLRRLVNLALDVILSYSDKPIRLTIKVGLFISVGAILFACSILLSAVLWGTAIVPGWASLMISLWFLSGLNIFVLGIVGLYVGKIFDQTKNRPLFIISDKLNFDSDKDF